MTTSIASPFSHYLLHYRHYVLSHYIPSLRPQSFCQRSSRILQRSASPLQIRLLIFVRRPASLGEVSTNLIWKPCLLLLFTSSPPPHPAHRFFPWTGWPVNERQGVQRDSLVLPGSSQWLMDGTLIRSDPSTPARTTCWRDSVAAVMNFSGTETQPFCKIFFREQSSQQSTTFLHRAHSKLTSKKHQQHVLASA